MVFFGSPNSIETTIIFCFWLSLYILEFAIKTTMFVCPNFLLILYQRKCFTFPPSFPYFCLANKLAFGQFIRINLYLRCFYDTSIQTFELGGIRFRLEKMLWLVCLGLEGKTILWIKEISVFSNSHLKYVWIFEKFNFAFGKIENQQKWINKTTGNPFWCKILPFIALEVCELDVFLLLCLNANMVEYLLRKIVYEFYFIYSRSFFCLVLQSSWISTKIHLRGIVPWNRLLKLTCFGKESPR